MSLAEVLQGWHDVYMTAGAAAATLAGLLFVGLSLHIKVVVSDPNVRSLARVTYTEFVAVLLAALAMLQPADHPAQIGDWLLATAAVSAVLTIRPAAHIFAGRASTTIGLATVLARFGIGAIAFVGIAAAGVVFLTGSPVDAADLLMPVIVLLVLVAVRNSWDLLVTVAEQTNGLKD